MPSLTAESSWNFFFFFPNRDLLPRPRASSLPSLPLRPFPNGGLRRENSSSCRRIRRDEREKWTGDTTAECALELEDLEAEIYDFTLSSANSAAAGFPTREQLIAAGRADLAEAIAAEGGWLASGWCLDDGDGGSEAIEASCPSAIRRRVTESVEEAGLSSLIKERNNGLAMIMSSQHESGFSAADKQSEEIPEPDRPEKEAGKGIIRSHRDSIGRHQNQMHLRLNLLESDLTSQLRSLRSRAYGLVSKKALESSLGKLCIPSDAWEFQMTEIMNGRDKLRSVRAKLSVLEGKTKLEIIDDQKILDEKHRRLDGVKKALQRLRSTYVVWPNAASEVFLTGSFDGWAGKKKMEKSSTGFFFLYLKLYPGRYEIKYIVNGAWEVDRLHATVVDNNGNENNLLIVS